ncbi:hypothetical protein I302_107624 [Kwoniella bestiolae CBS 10118]|uniref:Salicylate hydroxylase n=1 Tax=Kwoniella bestiolae CBS 10118 TaxID=1296100 RepID=A0A1B9FY11_9TREE|nr:hypothetical protein I302_06637 [Kwoniella bestiolae CBS 10118]OCF23654.1 hypothetical protein I302_06637 [Kwoniella bestiolae CBS 10118]
MSSQPRIAIIGGGISGVCLAIALQKRNLNITIYEQAPKFGEVGAGVAFNPAATRAMKLCSPDIYDAFEKVATRNISREKQKTWFDWLDGEKDEPVGQEPYLFSLTNEFGANAVHRAHFLDEIVGLLREGTTRFGKHLDTIEDQGAGRPLVMKFHDGSEETADAIIGCDGIKSSVRTWMLGEDHPGSSPSYTHKYAYRGLIPMDKAVQALGEDLAQNAKMHMGHDGHVLTFPVDHGETMNVVAFRTNSDPWPSSDKLVLPSEKSHVRQDLANFGPTVQKIIDILDPKLDCWAIFDLGDHPLDSYHQGRVCLLGDSAHATSPHHGAGAGMCIEDVAIMAELLNDSKVKENGVRGIEIAFKTFSEVRKERTQWLVQSSRRSGDLYEWRVEGVGRDIEKIQKECKESNGKIWSAQITEMVEEARAVLKRHF